jgi:hypothetical protein
MLIASSKTIEQANPWGNCVVELHENNERDAYIGTDDA